MVPAYGENAIPWGGPREVWASGISKNKGAQCDTWAGQHQHLGTVRGRCSCPTPKLLTAQCGGRPSHRGFFHKASSEAHNSA